MKKGKSRRLPWSLVKLQFTAGTNLVPTATVELSQNGFLPICDTATGNGPINAACLAINRITGINATLTGFNVTARGQGSQASALATVEVTVGACTYNRTADDTDVVSTSVTAYLGAINQHIASLAGEAGTDNVAGVRELAAKFA